MTREDVAQSATAYYFKMQGGEKPREGEFSIHGNSRPEGPVPSVREVRDMVEEGSVVWININSTAKKGLLEAVWSAFQLEPRHLESVVTLAPWPPAEGPEAYVFVTTRNPYLVDASGEPVDIPSHWVQRALVDKRFKSEQLAMFIGPNWLITIQERPRDVFAGVRERLRNNNRKLRTRTADHLGFTLLQAVVDSSFHYLSAIDTRLDEIRKEALSASSREAFNELMLQAKEDLYEIRLVAAPQRDALSRLEQRDADGRHGERSPQTKRATDTADVLVRAETLRYFRNIRDHVARVNDIVDTQLDRARDLQEVHNVVLSNRLNRQMWLLNSLATIAIPVALFTGLFGMNVGGIWGEGVPWAFTFVVLLVVGYVVAASVIITRRRVSGAPEGLS